MKAAPLTYLRSSLTMSAANTFTEAAITTGLAGETSKCLAIRHLMVELPAMVETDGSVAWTLSRKSTGSSAPSLSNKYTMIRDWQDVLLTTSGLLQSSRLREKKYDGNEMLIFEETIYFGLVTSGYGSAQTGYIVMACEEMTISSQERVEAMLNALN